MEFSAQQIAAFLNGKIEGDPDVKVSNFSKIEEGKPAAVILQSALGLLHEGRWRVYEIAEQTGFGDYKNFVQAFRKYLGLSPTEYQKQRKHIR